MGTLEITPTSGEIVKKVHYYPVRVHYESTDAGGIVYHTEYLKFCERARTEFFRLMTGSLLDLQNTHGILIVVHHMDVSYHTPAKFDDALVVQSRLQNFKGARFEMLQEIFNTQNKKCLTNVVNLVSINEGGKPKKFPDALRQKLAKFI